MSEYTFRDEDGNLQTIELVKVPYLPNPSSAGLGNPVNDEIEYEYLSAEFVRGIRNPYICKVSGESMIPHLLNKDILILDYLKDKTPRKNGTIISCILNSERLVKYFLLTDDGIVLRSANKEYDDIVIKEFDELFIEGEVKNITRSIENTKSYWMR